MDSASIHRHVAMLREAMSGEYSSATRVVDALLDLRLLAAESPVLVGLIDLILAGVASDSDALVRTIGAVRNGLEPVERHPAHGEIRSERPRRPSSKVATRNGRVTPPTLVTEPVESGANRSPLMRACRTVGPHAGQDPGSVRDVLVDGRRCP